jgi:hypothetical protein
MEPLVRISNGHARLAVSPSTGRIVEYGLVGGPNVLWTNPRAPECKSPFEGWKNWGGDKVWIWPEADWRKWQGKNVPPGDPPVKEYQASVKDNLIVMNSHLIEPYGVIIARSIQLDAASSKVTITNVITRLQDTNIDLPVTPWTVTQLPAEGAIYARLIANAKPPGYAGFRESPWRDVKADGDIVTMTRPAKPWMKIGLDADVLAKVVGDQIFVAQIQGDPAREGYEPLRRAQVFSDPDDSPFRLPGIPPYIELEFTGPLKKLKKGESAELSIRWELKPNRGSPAELLTRD